MAVTDIQAVGERILIKKTEVLKKTASGIHLPGSDKSEDTSEGVVLTKGRKVSDEIELSNKIIYTKYAGTGLVHEESELLFVLERDVLGYYK